MANWLDKYKNDRRQTNARKDSIIERLTKMGVSEVLLEFVTLDEAESLVEGRTTWRRLRRDVKAAIVFNRGLSEEEAAEYARSPKALNKLDRRDPFPKYEPPCPEVPVKILHGGLPN
ncbi:MAG: hypothetical protein A2089_03760 [Elusimicrobia bacterium GWD2_63_28]|nr:MAG: hypothetical protein A2089_03760 [Elusimicrobia bacterium GWD2_63_28]